MLRSRATTQAFIIAALVILLCLVCLTGATLAIFTSNPKDGTIGVVTTAGDLSVDIIDTSAEGASLINSVLEFQTTDEREEIYFEPGAVICTQGFKVKNTGDIPINFRLYVSEDENIDMEKFHEAFELWISESNTARGDAQLMTEFTGSLEPGLTTDATYYLFVKMKESAGNEFQDQEYTGIGVTVYAVQGNVDIDTKE